MARVSLDGRAGFDAESGEEARQAVRGHGIDVQFGGFGDEFDVGHAGGKGVVDPGGALLDFALALGGDAPEELEGGAVDGPGSEIVAADLVELGGGTIGFAADGIGQGEGDGGEGGGDPEDHEEGAAPAELKAAP